MTRVGEVSTQGVPTCIVGCTSSCLAGCAICLADGPIFIADTATGGASLASGAGAGATT